MTAAGTTATTRTTGTTGMRGRPGMPGRPGTPGESPAGRGGDGGIATIEVVIMLPVLIFFVLVLVAFGQLSDARGELDGAARDAARAGSLHGNLAKANNAAATTVGQELKNICVGAITITHTNTRWAPGGVYTVQVSCLVRGLSDLGLPLRTHLSSEFASPLDPYRRFE